MYIVTIGYWCIALAKDHSCCVLVPPLDITVEPNNVTAKVYGSVTFVCYTNGFGDLSFVWEFDDSVISTSNSTLQQNSLTIHSLLPQHQGQYKCIATSPYSNSSSYAFATLNLKGNPICSIYSLLLHWYQYIYPSTIIWFRKYFAASQFQCISRYDNCFYASNWWYWWSY